MRFRNGRFGAIVFSGQHHEHDWAFVCQYLNIPGGFGGVLGPHMCGVKKEIGGPNKPHDAGSWGAAGTSKCARNPCKTVKVRAVDSVCGCKYQSGSTCTA